MVRLRDNENMVNSSFIACKKEFHFFVSFLFFKYKEKEESESKYHCTVSKIK